MSNRNIYCQQIIYNWGGRIMKNSAELAATDIPEQPKTKGNKAIRTRDLVQKAALTVMERKGYDMTTIRAICKEAGVSIGTFYLYFENKNAVFMDLYKNADDYFAEVVSERLSKISSVSEKIREFFREYAKLQINTGISMVKVLYNPHNSWFTRTRPMHEVLARVILEAQANGEMTTDLSAETIERYLFTLARGCCYDWCIFNGEFDLVQQMDLFIKTALPGLCVN